MGKKWTPPWCGPWFRCQTAVLVHLVRTLFLFDVGSSYYLLPTTKRASLPLLLPYPQHLPSTFCPHPVSPPNSSAAPSNFTLHLYLFLFPLVWPTAICTSPTGPPSSPPAVPFIRPTTSRPSLGVWLVRSTWLRQSPYTHTVQTACTLFRPPAALDSFASSWPVYFEALLEAIWLRPSPFCTLRLPT